jgi:hypothetical protein
MRSENAVSQDGGLWLRILKKQWGLAPVFLGFLTQKLAAALAHRSFAASLLM